MRFVQVHTQRASLLRLKKINKYIFFFVLSIKEMLKKNSTNFAFVFQDKRGDWPIKVFKGRVAIATRRSRHPADALQLSWQTFFLECQTRPWIKSGAFSFPSAPFRRTRATWERRLKGCESRESGGTCQRITVVEMRSDFSPGGGWWGQFFNVAAKV